MSGKPSDGVVFLHRDHYTVRGTPKRPLTLTRAQEIVDAHNATVYGRKANLLVYYRCTVCDQWHVGHRIAEISD